MKLTLHEVAQVLGAKTILVFIPIQHSTRSSSIADSSPTGDLFVPLKGARDGHDFIPVAFENGCAVTLFKSALMFPTS